MLKGLKQNRRTSTIAAAVTNGHSVLSGDTIVMLIHRPEQCWVHVIIYRFHNYIMNCEGIPWAVLNGEAGKCAEIVEI
jgi:hypothetical protein